MADRKYYWIKLKKDFMTSDAVDFLMSQKNGANYVVLYQMLCLMTTKTNGRLERQLNEVIIPYDVEKIQRDTKYFEIDTVRTALSLFSNLGLIYNDENNCLIISNYSEMVGSETKWAEKKRNWRDKKIGHCPQKVLETVHPYVRQDIEIDKEIDIDNKKEINKEKRKKFKKPTLQELTDFCRDENLNNVDCEKFINYYDSNGWLVGKNSMKDWRATARNWNRKQFQQYGRQKIQLKGSHLNDNPKIGEIKLEDLPF